MSKSLQAAHALAAENHDLEHFKNILRSYEQERIEAEAKEANKAKSAKKGKKSKNAVSEEEEADEDVDMVDAEEEEEKAPKSSRKRKAAADEETVSYNFTSQITTF